MEEKEQLWPDWETVGLLGKGSYGSVYEIKRTVMNNTEKAALKVISIPQSDSEIEDLYGEGYNKDTVSKFFIQHLQGILSEYTLMRKVSDCKNVVFCEDVDYIKHEDGIGWDVFIKMELLTPFTKAYPGTVDEKLVVQLGKDLCNALAICKHYGVIHRDIKPQNIFVDKNGVFKLGDFGVAKAVERTSNGTKIGTYKYMAPEVYNNQPYSSAADIYSLGLVLYWLLNERRMPFVPLPPMIPNYTDEEQAKIRRFRGEPIPEPKHGSPALKAVVLKACAFNPADRYGNAAQMLLALEEAERMPYAYSQQAENYDMPAAVQTSADYMQSQTVRPSKKKKVEKWAWVALPVMLLVFITSLMVFLVSRQTEEEPSVQNPTTQAETQIQTQPQETEPPMRDLRVGDTVLYGTYEQDNNRSNGAEQIHWDVVEVRDGRALLVSRHALECMPYHSNSNNLSWESCTLRQWLNGSFYDTAFTADEKQHILTSTVSVDKDLGYMKNPGNNTQDRVFLLSVSEVQTYYGSTAARTCSPTTYAAARGVWRNDSGKCWWWLRSPNQNLNDVFCVYSHGGIDDNGDGATDTTGGVRPAMWIDLKY